jgi:uncharacterized protein YqcC (DUF446 family)
LTVPVRVSDRATQDREEFERLIAAHGGLTGWYQAAQRSFDYSIFLKENQHNFAPDLMQRAAWLQDVIISLRQLHDLQLRNRVFTSALQTRIAIMPYIDELGAVIEKLKNL